MASAIAGSSRWASPAAAAAVGMIMCGCCVSVIAFEMVIRLDRSAGALFMLSQFLFIFTQTFIQSLEPRSVVSCLRLRMRPRRISLKDHFILTGLFLFTSWSANIAPAFSVSVPVTIIFRSSSVAANLLVGILVFGKSFHRWRVVGAAVVGIGALLSSLADIELRQKKDIEGEPPAQQQSQQSLLLASSSSSSSCGTLSTASTCAAVSYGGVSQLWRWLSDWLQGAAAADQHSRLEVIGILILVIGLVMGALLGHWQEQLFRTHGNSPRSPTTAASTMTTTTDPQTAAAAAAAQESAAAAAAAATKRRKEEISVEMQFYSHFFSLPVLLYTERHHIVHLLLAVMPIITSPPPPTTSTAAEAAAAAEEVDRQWQLLCWLLVGAASQAVCMRGVYRFLMETSSLSLVLMLSLRKLVSLVISVILFQNPFTASHVVGASMVTAGALLYSLAPAATPPSASTKNLLPGSGAAANSPLPAHAAAAVSRKDSLFVRILARGSISNVNISLDSDPPAPPTQSHSPTTRRSISTNSGWTSAASPHRAGGGGSSSLLSGSSSGGPPGTEGDDEGNNRSGSRRSPPSPPEEEVPTPSGSSRLPSSSSRRARRRRRGTPRVSH